MTASSPSQVLEKKAVSASLEKDDTNDTKSFEEKKAAEDSVAKTTADDSSSSPKEENKKENPFEVLANNSEQEKSKLHSALLLSSLWLQRTEPFTTKLVDFQDNECP